MADTFFILATLRINMKANKNSLRAILERDRVQKTKSVNDLDAGVMATALDKAARSVWHNRFAKGLEVTFMEDNTIYAMDKTGTKRIVKRLPDEIVGALPRKETDFVKEYNTEKATGLVRDFVTFLTVKGETIKIDPSKLNAGKVEIDNPCPDPEGWLEKLTAVLDGSADQETLAKFREHVVDCLPCYKWYNLEYAIKQKIMNLPKEHSKDELVLKIKELLRSKS